MRFVNFMLIFRLHSRWEAYYNHNGWIFRLFDVTEVASNSSLLLVEIFCLFAQMLAFVAQITFTSCTICVLPLCFFLLASMICTSPILHFISAWLFNVSSPAFHCLFSILLTCYCFLVSVHILAAKTSLKDWMFRGIQNLFQVVFYISWQFFSQVLECLLLREVRQNQDGQAAVC